MISILPFLTWFIPILFSLYKINNKLTVQAQYLNLAYQTEFD